MRMDASILRAFCLFAAFSLMAFCDGLVFVFANEGHVNCCW